jgi:PilZ domain
MDGVTYHHEEIESAEALPPRHAARESIFLGAQLIFPHSAQPLSVRVRNISPGGMMVDHAANVPVGEQVVADIKGVGPVYGKVAWVANGRIGIAFDREIDPQQARVKVGDGKPVDSYQVYKPTERRPGLAIR